MTKSRCVLAIVATLCASLMTFEARAAAATPEQVMASAVERVALVNHRLTPSPSPSDHLLAYTLIAAANDIDPGDAERVRRLVDAAWGTGDRDLLEKSNRELIRVDPSDTVAQLRLINARIAERQTIEGRLELYGRLLDEGAGRLDASIRSRLALDAALLHRELGQSQRFASRLSEAIELDRTNKEAISVAVTYYAEHGDDPVGLFELKLMLLMADPLDPNVYFEIASTLAAEGVFPPATRYHANGLRLLKLANSVNPRAEVEQLSLIWAAVGPQRVVDTLTSRLHAERQRAQTIFEAQQAADIPEDQLVPPEAVHLDGSLEEIRFLASLAARDEAGERASLEELAAIARESYQQMRDPAIRADPEARARAVAEALHDFAEVQIMLGIAGYEIQEFPPDLLSLYRLSVRWSDTVSLIEAWRAFREPAKDDNNLTRLALNAISVENSIAIMLRAMLAIEEGDNEQAVSYLHEISRRDPLGAMASWARSEAEHLSGKEAVITELGKRFVPLAVSTPDWVDEMISEPGSFMRLSVEPLSMDLAPHDNAKLAVELVCLAPIPMAIGADRPINSRLIVQPRADGVTVPMFALQPEVIDFDRRLRLEPRQSVRAIVDADLGFTGVASAAAINKLVRTRWRVVQGFEAGITGGLVPGPLCLAVETPTAVRAADRAARLDADAFVEQIRGADGVIEIYRVARCAVSMISRSEPEEAEAIAESLAERYREATPEERTVMLATLPARSTFRSMKVFDDAAKEVASSIASSDDPTDRLNVGLTILTRVAEADHPLFEEASTGDRTVGSLVREALRKGTTTIATAPRGVIGLAGAGRPGAEQATANP